MIQKSPRRFREFSAAFIRDLAFDLFSGRRSLSKNTDFDPVAWKRRRPPHDPPTGPRRIPASGFRGPVLSGLALVRGVAPNLVGLLDLPPCRLSSPRLRSCEV
jgi:hypothetical protein